MILPSTFKSEIDSNTFSLIFRVIIKLHPSVNLGSWATESNYIYISDKNLTFDGNKYKPLLLSIPSVQQSIDINNRRFKINNVNLDISNIEYEDNIFSNIFKNSTLINANVELWINTPGGETDDDSILLYQGIIRDTSHDSLVVSLSLEDRITIVASSKLPKKKVVSSYGDRDINKPIPFVYGYLKHAPTVLDGNILKADYDEVQLITSGQGEYEGIGVNSNYEPLNIFEGVGESYEQHKSPVSIYIDDVPYPVLKNQALEGFDYEGEDIDLPESPIVQGGAQWTTFEDDDSGGVNTPGQISVKILTGIKKNLLQVQVVDKPSIIEAKHRIMHEGAAGWDYLDDGITAWDGWMGTEKFHEGYTETLTNNIYNSIRMENDSYLGFPLGWELQDFSPYAGGANNWDMNGLDVMLNMIKISWHYPPSFSYERMSRYVWTAINGQIIPKLYHTYSDLSDQRFLYVWERGEPGSFSTASAYAEASYVHVDLATDLNSVPELGNSSNTSFTYTFDNLFAFEDGWTHSSGDYSGTHNATGGTRIDISGFDGGWITSFGGDHTRDQSYVQFSAEAFGITNMCFGHHSNVPSQLVATGNDMSIRVQGNLNEIDVFYIAEIENAFKNKLFLNVRGREKRDGSGVPIVNIIRIMEDIAIREMDMEDKIDIDSATEAEIETNINCAFSVFKEIEAKKLLEDISKSTLCFPSFRNNGTLAFPIIKENYTPEDYFSNKTIEIKNSEIIQYNFELTDVSEVYTKINVKYNYDYHKKDFLSRAGGSAEVIQSEHQQLPAVLQRNHAMYPWEFEHYGFKNIDENILELESKYIDMKSEAEKIANKLFFFHKNQHLKVSLTLPLKYIAIEPGSLIKFPKLIDNMQAYGQNYTAAINYTQFQGVDEWAGWGDGQVYFPLFFVTSVNISQGDIVVEAIRLHRLNDNTSVQFDGWDDFGIGDIHGGYEWDPNLEGYCQWDGEIDFSHLRTEWSCMNSGGEAWYSQDEITPPDTDEDEEGLEVEEDEEFGVGYCLMPNGNLVSDIDEGDCVAMGGAWSDIAIDAPRGNFMFFFMSPYYNPDDPAGGGGGWNNHNQYMPDGPWTSYYYDEVILHPVYGEPTPYYAYWDEESMFTPLPGNTEFSGNIQTPPYDNPHSAKIITFKDLLIACPPSEVYTSEGLEYHAMFGNTLDPAQWDSNVEFGEITSYNDNSLLNFYYEFMHPLYNFRIGNVDFGCDTENFWANGENWELFYQRAFLNTFNNMSHWMKYQYWQWSSGANEAMDAPFWKKFVMFEVKIQDYRKFLVDFDEIRDNLAPIMLQDADIEAMIGMQPPTLPDWIVDEYQGKITIALVVANHFWLSADFGAGIGPIDQTELRWKIFPGHYDNYEYMDNYASFYDTAVNRDGWIFNDEEDIGWGYVLQGMDAKLRMYNESFSYLDDVGALPFEGPGRDTLVIAKKVLADCLEVGGYKSDNMWMTFKPSKYWIGCNIGMPWSQNGVWDPEYGHEAYAPINTPNPLSWNAIEDTPVFGILNLHPPEEYPQLPADGDVNLDSTLNILDVVAMTNFILGTGELESEYNADFNQDGTINVLDVVMMCNTILGAD